jgi:hypothetical protein
MGLLDYRKFLIYESDNKAIVATDSPAPTDNLLGSVSPDKVERIKSQIQMFSLDSIIDDVAKSSGDSGFAQVIKQAISGFSAEKIIGLSHILSNKKKIKFEPSSYAGSPSTKLWNDYVSFFTSELPGGAAPLSDSDLKSLWQLQMGKTRGSIGPGEIIMTVFTDMKKGTSGDLQGAGFSMEVKGQNAKGESYNQWRTVKAMLTKEIEADGVKIPSAKGFGKDWINVTTDWLKKDPTKRIPVFANMITGTTDSIYVNILKDSINSSRAGYNSNIDYGVLSCQFLWYSKKMGFQYLLAFANPLNNSPIGMVINMGPDVYNTFVANFQSPGWEENEFTGGLNLNGTRS